MLAALSVFYLLKLLAAEPCESIVINDPIKKETIAYKCMLPKKDKEIKK